MTRILTVDDSRAVRMLVKKALADMNFDISEAENGELGLAAVDQDSPDLILLDVTMPVLDGPGMLERLRGKGNPTPVLLLTAESGTSVIGPMLKQGGICDYIVKPFKPEQLRGKVIEALQRQGKPPAVDTKSSSGAGSEEGGGFRPAGKPFVDILLIDDMENVATKLRTMLPERLTFNSCLNRSSALTMCRERVYRAVIVDTDIPDVNSADLMRDLRILQPTAAFIALMLRSAKTPAATATELGFAAHLVKPFDPAQIEEFVDNSFGSSELLAVDGNVITPAGYKGAAGASEAFYRRLQQMAIDAASQVAAACHDRLIVNALDITPSPALAKFFLRLRTQCTDVGIELRVVGGPELVKLFKQLVETADIPVVASVAEAKAA